MEIRPDTLSRLAGEIARFGRIVAKVRGELSSNSPQIQVKIDAVLSSAESLVTSHGSEPGRTVANDLATIRSALADLLDDYDPGSDEPMFALEQAYLKLGLLHGPLDKALAAAADMGMHPDRPLGYAPNSNGVPIGALDKRSIGALLARLDRIETQIESLAEEGVPAKQPSAQQVGLIGYFVEKMRGQLGLARLELAAKRSVDFDNLTRAIGTMADLTSNFVASARKMLVKITDAVRAKAKQIGRATARVVRSVKTVVKRARRAIEPVLVESAATDPVAPVPISVDEQRAVNTLPNFESVLEELRREVATEGLDEVERNAIGAVLLGAHLDIERRAGTGAAGAAAERPDQDDLKRIRGIGVLIEKKLNALAVHRYEQIAEWDEDEVSRISKILDFKGRIERENWIEQARILSVGGTTEFSLRVDRGELEVANKRLRTIASILSKVAERSVSQSGNDQTEALVAAAEAYFAEVNGGTSKAISDLARLARQYANEGRRDYAIGLMERISQRIVEGGSGRLRFLTVKEALARLYIEAGEREKAARLQSELLESIERVYGKNSSSLIPLLLELSENSIELRQLNSAGLYLWRASEIVSSSTVVVDQVYLKRMDYLRGRMEELTRVRHKQ